MEFRLLGPIEVILDGEPVQLGGRQRRTVLSILLVHAGESVSTERLIDELWGDSPPETARKTVQAHIAHLRRSLNVHKEVLAAADNGYTVRADSIDVRRLEEMLEAARSLRSEDPERSAGVLQDALDLFRGAPIAGLADDSFSLRVEASRLQELRQTAIEDHLEARMAAGADTDLVSEIQTLVTEHPLRERLWAMLMLALYRSGRQAEALRAFSRARHILAEELGIEPSAELRLLEQRILDQDPGLDLETIAITGGISGRPAVLRNPYKGLRAFDEADAPDFFGRDDLIRRLLERVESRRGGLIVLAGPSGAGKSSAIRAGLIPKLRQLGNEVAVMFPGRDPLAALAKALTEVSGDSPEDVLDQLDGRSSDALTVDPLIVVVDQFEELFTMVDDQHRVNRFLDLMTTGDDNWQWIVTARADFLDRMLAHPRLGPLLEDALLLVPPFQDHEVEAAVVNPAHGIGVGVEPPLVGEIVRDLRSRPASLPLLQYALTDTFERRRDDTLTVADYERAGGISGALARRADELYEALDDSQKRAARQLLLHLVSITDDGETARRRVDRDALMSLPVDDESLEKVMERLGAQRLLTFDQDPESGHATVEVAHEALISEWPRLARWVEETRDDLRARERLAIAVGEWEASGHDPSFLLRGARLAEMEGWRERSELDLAEAERRFLYSSREAEDTESRRRTTRRRAIAGVLSTAAVVAAILAVVAFVQAREAREQTAIAQEQTGVAEQAAARAEEQARLATVRQLAAASVAGLDIDPELSTLLALEAVRGSGEDVLPEAEDALHRSLQADRLLATVPNGGNGIAHYSPTGETFVTLGRDVATAQLWDPSTLEPGPTLAGHSDLVFDAVYDAQGSRIATTSADGTVRIWDPATAETVVVLEVEGPPPLIPAFSRDGTMLAASSLSGVVWVWNLDTDEIIWRLDPPEGTRQTLNLEFSPDGSLLAVAPETHPQVVEFGAHIWDMSTGELTRILTGHDWDVKDVGFTPDGRLLATGSWDSTVRLWDVATWENVRTYFGHETSVWDIQISTDGTKIASSGTNEALVWDLETTETLDSLVGHTGIVDGIDFSPDGNLLLTASMVDATTRLWDIGPSAGPELIGLPGPPAGTSAGVVFSSDGATLVTTRDFGSVTMWEFPSGAEIRTVEVPTDIPDLLTFDPNGEFVALGGLGPTALLDVVDGDVAPIEGAEGPVALSTSGMTAVATIEGVRLLASPHASEGELLTDLPAYRLAFDPEERIVVMSLDDGMAGIVEVHDLATGEVLATLTGHSAPVWDVEFTSDGSRFVTASLDSTVTVWDATTLELIRRIEGHSGQVFDLALDPVRPEVATASDDGTVKIWDIDTGVVRLTLPGRGAVSVAYSPDGRYLATAGVEGRVDVFILEVPELAEVAQNRLTRWWTEAECVQYLGTAECPPSAPGL
ncbi:MAG: BTAD domain-containing putative transcriptional regulator [Acidimicrobiia bacterium]